MIAVIKEAEIRSLQLPALASTSLFASATYVSASINLHLKAPPKRFASSRRIIKTLPSCIEVLSHF